MATQNAMPWQEARTVGLISAAHLISHVYMVALPPLFPLIRAEFGISFAELAMAVTVFAIATAVLQTPMGFVCERIGPRPVLIGGLFVNSLALMLLPWAQTWWEFIGLMALAGFGNAVFHPADYGILSGSVDDTRIGRAYAAHSLGGQIGFAITPMLMIALLSLGDWSVALMAVGSAGVVLALMLLLALDPGEGNLCASAAKAPRLHWREMLSSPVILGFFLFYAFGASANMGLMYFGVPALTETFGISLTTANLVVTLYMTASMLMVLPGGWLADATARHALVILVSFGGGGVLMVVAGAPGLPFALAVVLICIVGAQRGMVMATRDAMVRYAAPRGRVGTVFAFVTTGILLGQTASPALYGLVLDFGLAGGVFLLSGLFSFLCAGTALVRSKA